MSAAETMMPGHAPAERLPAGDALLLCLRLAHLRRAKTWPGTADRRFVAALRGAHPDTLSAAQREHVARLAWRYRAQLPATIRPLSDPDQARGRAPGIESPEANSSGQWPGYAASAAHQPHPGATV